MTPPARPDPPLRSWLGSLGCALLLALAGPAGAAELRVAVAANFTAPMQQLTALYASAGGDSLISSSGSSGQLYAQIRQGAPFDVFLSADLDKPLQLERDGRALPGSHCVYAIGRLVLWSPQPGLVDDAGAVLGTPNFHLLAIASPSAAPYGLAARQVMQHLGVWQRLNEQKRIVTGENITQAWQFAASGNADLAFVALSQVLSADGSIAGSSWIPPQDFYARIEQAGVVLEGEHAPAARAFLHWLCTDGRALATIHAAGYGTGR